MTDPAGDGPSTPRRPRRRRKPARERPPRQAVFGSLGLHAALVALAVFATAAPSLPQMPPTVRVRMVAAAPEDAPIRVDPTPPEVAEEEFRPPPPEPTPDPQPQTETPTVVEEQPVEREPRHAQAPEETFKKDGRR